MAHELTHTIQQSSADGIGQAPRRFAPVERLEAEADQQAERVLSGRPVKAPTSSAPYLARFSVKGHHIIEESALAGIGFSEQEIDAIHRGNLQRDYSQVGRVGNTLMLCDPSSFGGYNPVEHFDNFIWDVATERWRSRGTGRRFRHQDPLTPDLSPVAYIESELLAMAEAEVTEPEISEDAMVHLGNAFHTVEDFFAHSNFVELLRGDMRFGTDLVTGSVGAADSAASQAHIIASVSPPRSSEFFHRRGVEATRESPPLSHSRIAKDEPGSHYHGAARRLAALVVRDFAIDIRAVMRQSSTSERRRLMTESVVAKVKRYLRPPNPDDPWWEALETDAGALIARRLERAAASTPESVGQCIFSPMRNIEASRSSSLRIPIGIALPVEVGETQIWIQGGFGISGPVPLERSPAEVPGVRPEAPTGLFGGVQITGTFRGL
jgi:hypothetical protein